jgi:hypothetical protein
MLDVPGGAGSCDSERSTCAGARLGGGLLDSCETSACSRARPCSYAARSASVSLLPPLLPPLPPPLLLLLLLLLLLELAALLPLLLVVLVVHSSRCTQEMM